MRFFNYKALFVLYLCKCSYSQPISFENVTVIDSLSVVTPGPEDVEVRRGRGMMHFDEHSYDDLDKDIMKPEEEQKAVQSDPWNGYYDFLINEGSFKFWAVFQLGTALVLIYSAFAAVYYAKFNPITSDYDDYDAFFFRSNGRSISSKADNNWFGLDADTFQNIVNAISSKKYL